MFSPPLDIGIRCRPAGHLERFNGGSGSGMRGRWLMRMGVGFENGNVRGGGGGAAGKTRPTAFARHSLECIFGPKWLLCLQLQTNCCTSIKQQSPPSAAPLLGLFGLFLWLWLWQSSKLVLAHKSQETCWLDKAKANEHWEQSSHGEPLSQASSSFPPHTKQEH